MHEKYIKNVSVIIFLFEIWKQESKMAQSLFIEAL